MPPIANQPGTWANGPTFPPQALNQVLGAKDAPGCLLPNGNVLCVAGPVDGVSGDYLSPTYFFEFDPVAGTLAAVTAPANSGGPPFVGRMLLLPTGQVLFANGSKYVAVYTPSGGPDPTWAPQITSCPTTLRPGWTYTLHGRQLNGLSQAVSYGDDAAAATNYPLVRLVQAGHTYYCRTHDHSSMGVATGSIIHTTQFTVPSGVPVGSYQLCVVANGISSSCLTVNVSTKIFKELKWEIKEKWELKENLKVEIDVYKNVIEDKSKDAERWGEIALESDWSKVIRTLVERSDAVEERLGTRRAFIRPEERPDVGMAALEERPGAEEAEDYGLSEVAARVEDLFPPEVLKLATTSDLAPIRHGEGETALKRSSRGRGSPRRSAGARKSAGGKTTRGRGTRSSS
jgi:hypothetical protein